MFALANCVMFKTEFFDWRKNAVVKELVAAIVSRVNDDETFDITAFVPNSAPRYVERVPASELSN